MAPTVETHIGAITNAWHSHFDTRSTHVSKHGFWLLLADEELLLSFEQFPWFRRATIEQICHVEWPAPEHIYWPELDIDLSLASIRQPELFPLVSRSCN